jgi:hypothetical protein
LSVITSAESSFPAIAERTQHLPGAPRRSNCHWTLIAFALVTVGLLWSPASSMLLYIFPVMTVLLASYLYRNNLADYVTLVCWLWFLTPLLRRMVDFHVGFARPALMLLAPPLALCPPAIWLFAGWRKVLRPYTAPMLCVLATYVYAAFIGVLNFDPRFVFQDLLTWVAPVIFAFTLIHHRDQAPEMFRAFEKAFIYGLLAVSVYGIAQFFLMPAWDAFWMGQITMDSIGNPRPTEVRVFSSMNAPQTLASFLVAGLIAAFNSRFRIRFVAIPAGLLCLALSLARSGWVAAAAGILYLLWKLPQRQRFQLVIAGLVAAVALIFALQNPDLEKVLSSRFDSLTDVKKDGSFMDRVYGYQLLFGGFLNNPFGLGMGATPAVEEAKFVIRDGWNSDLQDSTVATIMTTLGLTGGLVLMFSFFPIARKVLRGASVNIVATHTMQAVFIAMMAEAGLDAVVATPTGFLTWTSIGFCMALSIADEDAQPAMEAISATA